jgi:hypothetical protein
MAQHLQGLTMPTYTEYLAYAKRKGFQPMQATTFYAVIKAGINPINSPRKQP